ncbi:hypothetical protein [Leptotrichia wadei]|nr:hypothetical protein [Leptotrichia wadei]
MPEELGKYIWLAKADTSQEAPASKSGSSLPEEGYDGVMGVRSLRHVIEQQIRDNVTDFHLENLDAKHLIADMEDGVLVIKEKN